MPTIRFRQCEGHQRVFQLLRNHCVEGQPRFGWGKKTCVYLICPQLTFCLHNFDRCLVVSVRCKPYSQGLGRGAWVQLIDRYPLVVAIADMEV
eukprot:scaffold14371_cov40-Attheya_sp.AAC.5